MKLELGDRKDTKLKDEMKRETSGDTTGKANEERKRDTTHKKKESLSTKKTTMTEQEMDSTIDSIAKNLKKSETKPKLSEIEKSKRLEYIWDYYKLPIFAVICVCVAVIYTVGHIVTTKDNYAYVVAVNANFEDEVDLEKITQDYLSSRGQDQKRKTIFWDYNIQYDVNAYEQSLYDRMTIDTLVASKTVDLMVSTISTYKEEASIGVFMPVSEYLSEELMEKYKDEIVWVEGTDETERQNIAWDGEETTEGTKYARGIRVKNNPYFLESHLYNQDADIVLGIVGNTQNPEVAKDLLLYLLGETN